LKLVELSDRAKDKVINYSRGMKQRLLIARALLHKPRVIFLDEPTSGLDPHSSQQIRKMIKDFSLEGITVFLTTHYLDEAEALCNRVAIIDKGKIIALDKTEELKCRYSSQELKIRINENGSNEIITLDLNGKETIKTLENFLENKKVISIHTVEPTLEEVFLRITARGDL
jgi:ABC-type multidrug transport system ATPase subunit